MGFARLVLAIVIVGAHTSSPGNHYVWANLAVLMFYTLSGFNCTAAMAGKYQGRWLRFLAGRWLRLWPTYIAAFTLHSWVMVWVPIPLASIPIDWRWPASLLMLRPDVVPAAWVLPYMLLGYVAIALGLSGSPKRTFLWLLLSFVWAQHRALLLDWGGYYGSAAISSLSYAVGAAGYWMGITVPRDEGWAKVAGAVSFPLFLTHYAVAHAIAGLAAVPLGWGLFALTLAVSVPLSWALHLLVERPIERLRQKVRSLA